MGVIRVNEEAMRNHGYQMGDPSWTNLGQGQPEVGELESAPPRFDNLEIDINDHAYGPVEGLPELRQAIADHYNRLYRTAHDSKYTAANIAVSSGGRLALSRCGAAFADSRLGYFTPDYTAYEDLITSFPRLQPQHIQLEAGDGFKITTEELEARIIGDQLDSLLISNPCNPTGVIVHGNELRQWLEIGRNHHCTLFLDEFYSHFAYGSIDQHPSHINGPVSAAAYVDDVDEDRVILFDGLTKCFRYPGWRVGWIVAPQDIIQTITASGSFLDGGPSRPIQRAAIEVLEPTRADQETDALRKEFAIKQQITQQALEKIGITFPVKDGGTFYLFGNVSNLPSNMNTGETFMRAAFEHQVLTVPGSYFDVNPNRERTGKSPYENFVRFSFGPPRDNLEAGLERLMQMVSGG